MMEQILKFLACYSTRPAWNGPQTPKCGSLHVRAILDVLLYSSLHYGGHLLLEIVIVANYNNKPNIVYASWTWTTPSTCASSSTCGACAWSKRAVVAVLEEKMRRQKWEKTLQLRKKARICCIDSSLWCASFALVSLLHVCHWESCHERLRAKKMKLFHQAEILKILKVNWRNAGTWKDIAVQSNYLLRGCLPGNSAATSRERQEQKLLDGLHEFIQSCRNDHILLAWHAKLKLFPFRISLGTWAQIHLVRQAYWRSPCFQ